MTTLNVLDAIEDQLPVRKFRKEGPNHYRAKIEIRSDSPCARVASEIAKLALQVDCEITISNGDRTANGTSVLQLIEVMNGPDPVLKIETRGILARIVLFRLFEILDDPSYFA